MRVIAILELLTLSSATLLIKTRLPRSPPKALFKVRAFVDFPAYTCMAASNWAFAFGFTFFLFFCGQLALDVGAGSAAPYVLVAYNAASGVGRMFSGSERVRITRKERA